MEAIFQKEGTKKTINDIQCDLCGILRIGSDGSSTQIYNILWNDGRLFFHLKKLSPLTEILTGFFLSHSTLIFDVENSNFRSQNFENTFLWNPCSGYPILISIE